MQVFKWKVLDQEQYNLITPLKISNEKFEDIMKIFKYLEESGLLIKKLVKELKRTNKQIEQKKFKTGQAVIRADEGVITAGQDF